MKREGRPVPPELRELSQAADAVIAQARLVVGSYRSKSGPFTGLVEILGRELDDYDAAKAKLEDER